MSTATLSPTSGAGSSTAPATRVTFGHVLRAEVLKLFTLRSTWWTLGVAIVAYVGVASLVALGFSAIDDPEVPAATQQFGGVGLTAFTGGVQLASLAVVVIGVLTISGEYSTGMIRSTFAAVPGRLPALWAKAIVLFLVTLVVGAIGAALALVSVRAQLDGTVFEFELDGEAWRVIGGSVLYLATIAVFALAVGALLRHSAGALATVFGLLLVIENVISFISWEPLSYVRPFLPATSGSLITVPDAAIATAFTSADYAFEPTAWQGYGILVAWVAVLLAVAAVLMRRRDA